MAQAPADMWRKLRRSKRFLSELLIALGIWAFPHTGSVPLPCGPIDLTDLATSVFFRRTRDPHMIGGQHPAHGFAAAEGVASRSCRRQRMRRGEESRITGVQRDGTPDVPQAVEWLRYRQGFRDLFRGPRETGTMQSEGRGPRSQKGDPATSRIVDRSDSERSVRRRCASGESPKAYFERGCLD